MRKIKITALLLAVLMIVTAFAGCASKSTVTNLDNKVNDLDASIEEQKAALSGIESTLATISKALENQGSASELDDIKKDVEENKQNVADILAAIEDLKNNPTQAPADDVKVAAAQYSAKLEALEGDIEDDKANYTAESLATIREMIGDAEASIANAADAAGVKAAYDKLVADLAAYPSVNRELYDYVVALKGNITDKSAEKVADAEEALEKAIKFYEKEGGAEAEALTAYEVSATEEMNLVDEINKLVIAQESTLVAIKNRAADLNKEIAAIDASYSFSKVSEIVVKYKVWAREAAELSPENVALVTGYDALMAAQASALNTTAAKELFTKDTIVSKLAGTYGQEVAIFADYDALNDGAWGQVTFVYNTKNSKGETVKGLTSEIYAAIDAKISAWQEEYELTDAAVEYVIDTVKGTDFYEKYKADKALVEALEAEYEKFVAADGVFTAIKALNDKRLNAKAVEIANAYEKNAKDINAWKKASEEAYAAACAADVNGKRNVAKNDYATVLALNFNAMVNYADLCQYNGDAKNPEYGVKTPDTDTNGNPIVKYEDYAAGFAASADLYHVLYDFSDAKLVEFLLVDYAAAKEAAKAINAKIETFAPAQAISIRSIVEGIGGYAKLNAAGDKILALDEADIQALVAAATVPTTIAQFDYMYNQTKVYDLTDLIKTDLYEEKLALTESHIAAADAVAAELNSAYAALVGNNSTVRVTMNNVADVAKVYNVYTNKWLKKARADMDVATVINTTGSGVKEYAVKNILESYTAINGKTGNTYDVLDSVNGKIVKLNATANNLKAEANMVLTAYKMLDKMNSFNSNAFGLEPMSNDGYICNMYLGKQNNPYVYGIVSAKVSADPMVADGRDASGTAYKKDMYKWAVEYVTYNGSFTTSTLSGYYYTNNTGALKSATDGNTNIAAILGDKVWSSSGNDLMNSGTISKEALEDIRAYVKASSFGSMSNKLIPTFALAALALELDAKFQFDNNGTYAPIEAAKKAFDPANGGYGFNFIKGMTYMKLLDTVKDANGNLLLSDAHKTAIKSAANLEELRVVTNAVVIESQKDSRVDASNYINLNITFGAYSNSATDPDDFVIDGIVIYRHCEHASMAGACLHQSGVCTECGETISGTDLTTVTVKTVLVELPFNTGNAAKQIVLNVACACGITEDKVVEPSTAYDLTVNDSNGVVDAGDTIDFAFNGTEYTATFNGTSWDLA